MVNWVFVVPVYGSENETVFKTGSSREGVSQSSTRWEIRNLTVEWVILIFFDFIEFFNYGSVIEIFCDVM